VKGSESGHLSPLFAPNTWDVMNGGVFPTHAQSIPHPSTSWERTNRLLSSLSIPHRRIDDAIPMQ
jgi:hypothetical protein